MYICSEFPFFWYENDNANLTLFDIKYVLRTLRYNQNKTCNFVHCFSTCKTPQYMLYVYEKYALDKLLHSFTFIMPSILHFIPCLIS